MLLAVKQHSGAVKMTNSSGPSIDLRAEPHIWSLYPAQ